MVQQAADALSSAVWSLLLVDDDSQRRVKKKRTPVRTVVIPTRRQDRDRPSSGLSDSITEDHEMEEHSSIGERREQQPAADPILDWKHMVGALFRVDDLKARMSAHDDGGDDDTLTEDDPYEKPPANPRNKVPTRRPRGILLSNNDSPSPSPSQRRVSFAQDVVKTARVKPRKNDEYYEFGGRDTPYAELKAWWKEAFCECYHPTTERSPAPLNLQEFFSNFNGDDEGDFSLDVSMDGSDTTGSTLTYEFLPSPVRARVDTPIVRAAIMSAAAEGVPIQGGGPSQIVVETVPTSEEEATTQSSTVDIKGPSMAEEDRVAEIAPITIAGDANESTPPTTNTSDPSSFERIKVSTSPKNTPNAFVVSDEDETAASPPSKITASEEMIVDDTPDSSIVAATDAPLPSSSHDAPKPTPREAKSVHAGAIAEDESTGIDTSRSKPVASEAESVRSVAITKKKTKKSKDPPSPMPKVDPDFVGQPPIKGDDVVAHSQTASRRKKKSKKPRRRLAPVTDFKPASRRLTPAPKPQPRSETNEFYPTNSEPVMIIPEPSSSKSKWQQPTAREERDALPPNLEKFAKSSDLRPHIGASYSHKVPKKSGVVAAPVPLENPANITARVLKYEVDSLLDGLLSASESTAEPPLNASDSNAQPQLSASESAAEPEIISVDSPSPFRPICGSDVNNPIVLVDAEDIPELTAPVPRRLVTGEGQHRTKHTSIESSVEHSMSNREKRRALELSVLGMGPGPRDANTPVIDNTSSMKENIKYDKFDDGSIPSTKAVRIKRKSKSGKATHVPLTFDTRDDVQFDMAGGSVDELTIEESDKNMLRKTQSAHVRQIYDESDRHRLSKSKLHQLHQLENLEKRFHELLAAKASKKRRKKMIDHDNFQKRLAIERSCLGGPRRIQKPRIAPLPADLDPDSSSRRRNRSH